MGTSNSYNGPKGKTPLIPSWLDSNDNLPDKENEPNQQTANEPAEQQSIPPAGDPDRFRSARTYYSRFAGSGGRDRTSLGRAVSNYVSRASGGAKRAAQRMGASRTTSGKLVYFLSSVSKHGISQTLKALNLEKLTGQPIEDIFLGMIEYICPSGGSIDEGIAREAFIETIGDLAVSGITNLDNMTLEQIQTIFELYATHSIEARICNDIGNKTIILPANLNDIANIQLQLRDFIRRGVADAINSVKNELQDLTPERVQNLVGNVYEQAFTVLQAIGEAEGDVA